MKHSALKHECSGNAKSPAQCSRISTGLLIDTHDTETRFSSASMTAVASLKDALTPQDMYKSYRSERMHAGSETIFPCVSSDFILDQHVCDDSSYRLTLQCRVVPSTLCFLIYKE